MEDKKQPKRVNLDRFREILQKKTTAQERFKVDRYTEDIPAMLRECYINEVLLRGLRFADDKDTSAHIGKAARWLVNPDCKPGLILFGSVGNGKTTLARAIARLIGILYSSSVVSSERKYIASFSALELAAIAKNDPDRFETIRKAELLFIDDVGVEPSIVKVWGNEISPFVDIMYYRYDRQLFTIMTSNLNSEDLAEKYGVRVADRFTEMLDQIPFNNHSYRK